MEFFNLSLGLVLGEAVLFTVALEVLRRGLGNDPETSGRGLSPSGVPIFGGNDAYGAWLLFLFFAWSMTGLPILVLAAIVGGVLKIWWAVSLWIVLVSFLVGCLAWFAAIVGLHNSLGSWGQESYTTESEQSQALALFLPTLLPIPVSYGTALGLGALFGW